MGQAEPLGLLTWTEGAHMRMTHRLILAFMLCAAAAVAARADGLRDHLLVSPTWLAQHLNDPNVVVLFAGDEMAYESGHIPGASHVALSDLSTDAGGLTLEMLPVADLRSRIEALGISDGSHVVIAYGSLTSATRIAFTLDYAGLTNVSLLDGGEEAWTREGHPVSTEAPKDRRGTLAPFAVRPTVVDGAFVLTHLKTPHFVVVDARAAVFYSGEQTGGTARRAGHISGALSVPFTSVTNERGEIRPTAELAATFTKAGVQPDDSVIAYCHIGQQATAVLFAARLLGHPVLLYDGSFEDWSRHANYPVDNPAKRGGK